MATHTHTHSPPGGLPPEDLATIRGFIDGHDWRFAKTMADTPHEYIIVKRAHGEGDWAAAEQFVQLIRQHGVSAKYGKATYRYLRPGDGQKYWHQFTRARGVLCINRATDEEPEEPRQLKLDTSPAPRAIGILRISEVGDREDNGRLHSDKSQIAAIERDCDRNGLVLIDVLDESNVSGGAPLSKRPFGKAIERVERGEAQAIVFAWRDRTDRSITTGAEAIERMDAAGGILLSGGSVLTHATADKWAEATMGSFMGEWQRRVIKEKSADGAARAVAMGRVPFPTLPLGLLRNEDATARLDEPRVQEIVREAYRMRARGETIESVRTYLAEQGFEHSYRSVQILLQDRGGLLRGQIRHGDHVNLDPGFEAIVDRELWDAVQRVRVPSGRTAKSDRLLARLGVLRCASCGGRMVAGAQVARWGDTTRRYTFYKCGRGAKEGCPQPAVITAEPLERLVIEHVKVVLADAEERESAAREARDAADAAEAAQAALDAAQERFLRLPPGANEDAALALLQELTRDRDEQRARAERLASVRGAVTVGAPDVLDDPSPKALVAKRGLIRATLASVTVQPGRAPLAERVSFEPLR